MGCTMAFLLEYGRIVYDFIMALIQLNGIISNIKGSVGGVTFSGVRNGIALKRRLPGKRNVTTKQLVALNLSKKANRQWNGLTFGQKNAWNDFASVNTFTNRYGVTATLTGFNWFSTINHNRVTLSQPVVLAPPTYEVPAALPPFFVTMSSSTIVIEWSEVIDTVTTDVFVFASVPGKAQAQFNRGAYKLLNLFGVDVSSSFDITAAWEAATGLSYSAVAVSASFTINVLIVPVSKNSYISGVGQTASSQIPYDGVGFWAIGSTFEIS